MHRLCSIRKTLSLTLIILVMGLSPGCGRQKKIKTLYVATNGSDNWSGRLPAPNPEGSDGPLRTIPAARDRIRAARQADPSNAPAEVLIREGDYQISTPLVFEPQDSGTADKPVTYAAYPGEHPRISGGTEITGWKKGSGSLWTADIPAVRAGQWSFRQLFVDDQRVPRARTPNRNADPPYFKLTGVNLSADLRTQTLSLALGKIKRWQTPPDAEAVVLGNWEITRKLIQKVDVAKGVVTLSPPHLIGHAAIRPRAGMACYIENALELLDQPGEWYLDRRSGLLSYWPPDGQDMSRAKVVAPRLTCLLELKGRAGQTVHDLHFKGIDFEHTDWPLPAHGYHGQQACFYYPFPSPELARAEDLDMRMEFPQIDAAILCEFTESCHLEDGRFTNLGGVGIRLRKGCSNNLIQGNEIFSVSANGVMIGEYLSHIFDKPNGGVPPAEVPRNNRVLNNLIYNCGADYYGAVGIWAAFTDGTTIAHNLIHDLPYTGLSLGFAWNANPTTCKNNRLESNHIHHVMKELADGGGIYTLGLQPGTVLRGNLIHDVYRSPFAFGGAPNNGIFFDEGSKGFSVEDTIIYNTSGEAIRFNRCGKEDHTWKNNHLGTRPDAPDFPKEVAARAGLEPAYRKLSQEP